MNIDRLIYGCLCGLVGMTFGFFACLRWLGEPDPAPRTVPACTDTAYYHGRSDAVACPHPKHRLKRVEKFHYCLCDRI